jgi:hypothetical protein
MVMTFVLVLLVAAGWLGRQASANLLTRRAQ